jgi:hypothetical protein
MMCAVVTVRPVTGTSITATIAIIPGVETPDITDITMMTITMTVNMSTTPAAGTATHRAIMLTKEILRMLTATVKTIITGITRETTVPAMATVAIITMIIRMRMIRVIATVTTREIIMTILSVVTDKAAAGADGEAEAFPRWITGDDSY